MTWEKIIRTPLDSARLKRRDRACMSRSPARPDAAYVMLPRDMVEEDRVSIYASKDGRIAFEFRVDGEYAVRPTSRTSYTMRITIPKPLVPLIPMGLHDVDLERSAEGWLILKP